jgi:hypothetical protein
MKKVLSDLSRCAIDLGDFEFGEPSHRTGWVGFPPASEEEIRASEVRLNVRFPEDFKEFLRITNGFPQCVSIGVSFLPSHKIDYLKNIYPDLVEIWGESDVLKDVGYQMSKALLIGGLDEEQHLFLIPPNDAHAKWQYWRFANWSPGETTFERLLDHFIEETEFIREEISEGK